MHICLTELEIKSRNEKTKIIKGHTAIIKNSIGRIKNKYQKDKDFMEIYDKILEEIIKINAISDKILLNISI